MRTRWLVGGLALAGAAGWYARTGRYASLRRGEPGWPPYPEASGVRTGPLEVAHEFRGAMPTGVTVSRSGRRFVCYPRWEDEVPFTVAEIRDGREVPYPDPATNDPRDPDRFLSVQSVVVDPRDRLWALDTGSVDMGPIRGQAWPKLVGIDLATDRVFAVIRFPPEVVLPTTYLDDVRFDLRRGADGVAFVTDSSAQGPNGIVVVDLASGRSWRKLHGRRATSGDRRFVAIMEGRPLLVRRAGEAVPRPAVLGADGIALSADGSRLFFTPLSSRSLYSVSADALADGRLPDGAVVRTVEREARRFASDGLEADAEGRLYLTDWEHNAVIVRSAPGRYGTLVADPRLWWPDTLSLGGDGYLYVTANQLHRQAKFHSGRDLRERPYFLFRVGVRATPVALDRPGRRAASA